MDSLLALVLAAALSEEELRFVCVREQEDEGSCGLAAAASLLSLYCGTRADEADIGTLLWPRLAEPSASGAALGPSGGISLADVAFVLDRSGLRARAYRMDQSQLEAALDAGFAPIVVHYRKPLPHFALLLARGSAGSAGPFLVLADPARGLEALPPEGFAARWSGAALLVERAALTPEGRGLLEAALEGCRARLDILARGEAARAALVAARDRTLRDVDARGSAAARMLR